MAFRNKTWLVLFLMALLGVFAPSLRAKARNSGPAAVNLLAIRPPGVGIAVSPSNVNFTLVNNAIAAGNTPVTITTAWDVQPSVGNITLYAFFSTTTAALTNGAGNNIASARVRGSVNGGGFGPFSGNSPFAVGSSLQIYTFRVLGFNRRGTRSDTLDLQIDLTGQFLPAGTYSGVLLIRAQAL